MLVFTRKPREAVAVGDADHLERLLKITVLAIKHGSVRLGFEVAGDVPVHRWEVWERIQKHDQAIAETVNSGSILANAVEEEIHRVADRAKPHIRNYVVTNIVEAEISGLQ